MALHVYLVKFTSGYFVRAWTTNDNIIDVAQRLRDTYANYYKITHDVQDIVCEKC
jgi:hypothetical protein